MNCKRCGYPIKVGDKICKSCGLQINSLNNRFIEENKANQKNIYNIDNNYGRNIAQNLKEKTKINTNTSSIKKKTKHFLLIIILIIMIVILVSTVLFM